MNKPATANPVFSEVLQHIQQARHKIFSQANTALIDLYWLIGKTISHKVQSEAWGKGVVTELARYIAENAESGDVAVTADIPLAALLVPKGVAVIDPRGEVYTAESIGERLSVRDFMDGLRSTGVDTGGHAPFGSRETQAFANALDRALTRALKR